MAAKTYEIAFKLAGHLSANFAKTFKGATNALKGFGGELESLNKQAAKVDNVIKLRKEVGQSAREYIQAKQKVAELGRAISATESPTKAMIAEFNKAQAATTKAKNALDRKRTALKQVEATAGTTGQSLRTLINRQNELTESANRARAAQERLADITARQQKVADAQGRLHSAGVNSAASLAGMGAMAAGTVGMPVKEAMAMEDAMAEVRKVTDFTPEGLEKAREEIEKMSTRIPMTADGLAKIMASAAQSGVAQKDLMGFTEQAAKMGIAFDISAEEAGEMMAKWQSGMKLTQDQTYKLADAVNELSNNNAATAAQVGEVLKRYGALGKVAGLTEKQTAAFAASVVAGGAEADTAATGIKAFMRAMGKGSSMSKPQAGKFAAVGIDTAQLQEDLQKDAPAAIIKTLETIKKKVPAEKVNEYLSVMFGDEAAIAVGPMMQNLEGLKENFKLVADEASYSGSMLKEFQSRSSTTSNALQLAKNAAMYAARAIGQPLLEPMKKAAESFVKNAMAVGEWISKNQTLVMGILKVGGAVVGAVAAFHAIRLAVVFLVSPIMSLYRGFLLAQKAIMLYRSGLIQAKIATVAMRIASIAQTVALKASILWTKAVTAAQWLWNAALTANPIGLVIVAIGALIAVGILLYKNWNTIKATCLNLWSTFSSKFPAMAEFVKVPFQQIMTIVNGVKTHFKLLISFVKNVFTGQWGAAWQNVRDIFANAFSTFGSLVKTPLNAVIGLVNSAISGLNKINVDIPEWVPKYGGKKFGINIPQIPQLAKGGIATAPTLAMIGEGREDEAVLPLSRLQSMMGAGGGGINVTFSPTINITGGGNDAYAQVERGLKNGAKNLKDELDKLMMNQRRVSYA